MITIKTADLKEFFKRTSFIKTNSILPILSYIEIRSEGDSAIITKTNQHVFCQHQVEIESDKNETILVEQDKLTALLDSNKADTITITSNGKKVELYDGTIRSAHGVIKDGQHFPKFPTAAADSTRAHLPFEFIEALQLAKHLVTSESELRTSFIFVKKQKHGCDVFSTNNFILYVRAFKESLPDMCLVPEVCGVLNQAKEWDHYSNERFDFFDCGRTVFAFIKSEHVPVNYTIVTARFSSEKSFTVERQRIFNYVDYVCKIAPAAKNALDLVECQFSVKGNNLVMRFEEQTLNESADSQVPIEGNFGEESGSFNAKMMLQVLKTVPYEKVTFSRVDGAGCWFVSTENDPDYIGSIQKLNV